MPHRHPRRPLDPGQHPAEAGGKTQSDRSLAERGEPHRSEPDLVVADADALGRNATLLVDSRSDVVLVLGEQRLVLGRDLPTLDVLQTVLSMAGAEVSVRKQARYRALAKTRASRAKEVA